MGEQGGAVDREVFPETGTSEVNERRQDVECRDVGGDAVRGEERGVVDQKRDAHGSFEVRHLVPESPLAEHVAVVAGEDDDGFFV